MYGDTELTGKQVVFDATNLQDASIKLVDVVPGDAETVLTGIAVSDNGFNGSTKTTAAEVAYTGALKDKVLTLTLNVTMNDPQGWAKTYGLADMELVYDELEQTSIPETCKQTEISWLLILLTHYRSLTGWILYIGLWEGSIKKRLIN